MSKRTLVVVLSVVVLVVGGGAWAAATVVAASSQVKACVTSKGVIRSATAASACPKGTKARAISVVGPRGAAGPKGSPGAPGPQGPGAVSARAALNTSNGPYALASAGPLNVSASCVGGIAVTITQGDGQVGRISGTLTQTVDSTQTRTTNSFALSGGKLTFTVPSAGASYLNLQLDALVTVVLPGASEAKVYELAFAVYRDSESSFCDTQVRITP